MTDSEDSYAIVSVSNGLHFLGKPCSGLGGPRLHEHITLTDVWELVLIKQQMLSPSGEVTGMTSVATLLPFGIGSGPLKQLEVSAMSYIDCEKNDLTSRVKELLNSVSDSSQKQRAKDVGIELASSMAGISSITTPRR